MGGVDGYGSGGGKCRGLVWSFGTELSPELSASPAREKSISPSVFHYHRLPHLLDNMLLTQATITWNNYLMIYLKLGITVFEFTYMGSEIAKLSAASYFTAMEPTYPKRRKTDPVKGTNPLLQFPRTHRIIIDCITRTSFTAGVGRHSSLAPALVLILHFTEIN